MTPADLRDALGPPLKELASALYNSGETPAAKSAFRDVVIDAFTQRSAQWPSGGAFPPQRMDQNSQLAHEAVGKSNGDRRKAMTPEERRQHDLRAIGPTAKQDAPEGGWPTDLSADLGVIVPRFG